MSTKVHFGLLKLLIPFSLAVPSLLGSTYYLDGSVAVSGNGTSWASAWKSFNNIAGLRPGDTVYISGGSSGQTYNTGAFLSPSGTSGNPITYKVSSDAGHNGVVTINCANTCSGGQYGNFIYGVSWVTFDGNVDGNTNLVIQGWNQPIVGDSTVGEIFRYVTVKGSMHFNNGYNVELDHVLVDAPANSDRAVFGPYCGPNPDYTNNSIHDSTVQVRYGNTSGFGDDAFGALNCALFYNNRVLGVYDAAQTIQHQDGIQTSNSYLKIYNNYFYNLQNYPIYGDQLGGTLSHWRIYNNVFYAPNTSQGYQAIAMGCDGQTCTNDDLIIANNTVVGGANCIWVNTGYPGTLNNSYIVNNICYNAGSINVVGGGTQSNNTTATNGITFLNATSDWHLQSSATGAIGKGISPSYLTTVYTTDKDGNQRTTPWDIGAYRYGSVAPPSPPTDITATVK